MTTTNSTRTRQPQTESTTLTDTLPENVSGTTEVATDVIAAIAGHVAVQVDGVARLGGGSMLRRLSDSVSSEQRSKGAGIQVQAGKKEAIFDLDIAVKYGRPIPDIVSEVRSQIIEAIGTQVGLRAKEINIMVSSIDFGEEDQDESERQVE